MRDNEGAIVKWFGTNTDIHDLKTAQSDAERASRAKDAFLAALSHELRTPLTPVLMTAAALRGDERLPVDARDQLSMMERNIALEARLIDDLLDLTRISRGQLHLRSELCDAHSLIGLAVEIVRDDALAKGISLERKLRAQHSGLVADPARFQQVIWNLLRNAVKFTPRGGTIIIRTSDEGAAEEETRLRIEVADSGIGIDPTELEKIFLPFEQSGHPGDHRFGGIGLGLAIARAIVDLHGGTITAESSGPDRGSTFIVEIPGATIAPHGVADTPTLFPSLSADGTEAEGAEDSILRLLVVEDHESTLEVLARLLVREGHQVVATATLAAALEAAAKSPFDLVISDLGLPDGTGNELMEILRARYHLRGIALSGYGMEDDVARSRQAGFATHLTKPVDFRQLRRALHEVMNGEASF
jgi:nitrogen-specific signal transduction histidine kinase/ActR/RegA family two-component response regulator